MSYVIDPDLPGGKHEPQLEPSYDVDRVYNDRSWMDDENVYQELDLREDEQGEEGDPGELYF